MMSDYPMTYCWGPEIHEFDDPHCQHPDCRAIAVYGTVAADGRMGVNHCSDHQEWAIEESNRKPAKGGWRH